MASAFSHIAAPIFLRLLDDKNKISWRLLALGCFLSIAPDLDSIGFKLGVPYESQWGHRGFTHSLVFAALMALLILPLKKYFKTNSTNLFVFSFLSMASHGVLDALTSGGLGVAFFWPLNLERYFFPWHPIKVSPIGISQFFSARGLQVITSELFYIWLPVIAVGGFMFSLRRGLENRSND